MQERLKSVVSSKKDTVERFSFQKKTKKKKKNDLKFKANFLQTI